MFIREAKEIADTLVTHMRPFCQRIQIAGSIRRLRQDVKDIELVAIPKWGREATRTPNLFGDPGAKHMASERANLLHEWATMDAGCQLKALGMRTLKPGTKNGEPLIFDWPLSPDGKYWRFMLKEGIKLDLFLTGIHNFGVTYLIRTGSKDFSQAVATFAKYKTRYRFQDGYLCLEDGSRMPTPEERDVFDTLGIDWVEPNERSGRHMVMRDGRPQFPKQEGR